ncbi:MAG: hypothetical protein KAS70_02225, partial [Planctomycetes bacterium]|nr:hypothetical protein [Planctomycetota bacterium]
ELEYWDGSGAGSWESIGTWPIPAGAGGSGSYNWTIANAIAPDAKLRITDANDGTVSDESDTFRINGGIDVTSPGIEIWTVGETRPISWTLNGTIPLVNIYYSTDNFATITKTIKTDASGAAEVFTWSPVTDDVTAGFNARIKVTNAADESNMQGTSQGFKVRGILTLTYPPDVDGRIYRVGQTIPINWTSNANSISQVKLFINGEGAPFQTVPSFKGSNSWDWTIPASATSDDVRIKIEDINDSDVFSVGSKYFMVKPDVKMTEPGKDPGEVYKVGTPIDIIFDFTGTDNATLKFYYNKGGGDVEIGQKVDVLSGTNTFNWPNDDNDAVGSNVTFKIKDPSDSYVTSDAANNVKIVGDFTGIELTKSGSPVTVVMVNDSVQVEWTGEGTVPYVKI